MGERIRFDGQVRVILAVSARSITVSDLGKEPRAVPPADLFAADDFEVSGGPGRMPLPSASLLETLPSAVLEKALWWEAHVLEVLHGLPPDAAPGTEPKPEYALALSLTARERAKAAELSAAGHKVSASTVGSQRRSYETGGVLGLADRRAARKTPKYGTVDAEVVAAMQQAISEAVDASTRNGAFLLWRTGEILKSREEAQAVELPSRHNFLASCRFLEIDVQPAHKGSPFEKGHIEKMLSSVGTLFVQFLSGFTGRNTDRRGRRLDRQPLWSLLELQELLDGARRPVAKSPPRWASGPLPSREVVHTEREIRGSRRGLRLRPGRAQRRRLQRVAASRLARGQRLRHQDQAPHLRRP
ncbi:hypothetical protein [Streptomyces sp. NPDC059873]|uniref:hypothetical protein n=1 Tax=Streptomyces sp. NPDC059873 TaxID=3346982 RepID=UPI003660C9ED